MHILIAPNAFKNGLDATAAAEAIREGLLQSGLRCTTECFPIADGGDGTADLILQRCQGRPVSTAVHDPLGRPLDSSFGLIDHGTTAVIEMAKASGLRLLASGELNPLRAISFGTGEQIRHALDRGVKKIYVAMGGSATVDGGSGILTALGVVFRDSSGVALQRLPESLVDLAVIDVTALDPRIRHCEVNILCDVDNLLLGEHGAAAVFGPQKGASVEAVRKLNASLQRFSEVALRQFGVDITTLKYGGTAGGAAAGLCAVAGARLVNGIDHFLELTRFDESLSKADILITGEGSLDAQTLQGKGPMGAALRAKKKNIPVVGMAGRIPLDPSPELRQYFDVLMPIGNEPTDLSFALLHTAANLKRTGFDAGRLLSMQE